VDTWAIAILPLVGVVLGAALHFWFSRAAARMQHADTLQSQAYADYLRAVTAIAHQSSETDLSDGLRNLADAKARIAIYGSKEAIKALSEFEEAGAVLFKDHPAADMFISLVSSMRPSGSTVSRHELELVLLGTNQQGESPDGDSRRR